MATKTKARKGTVAAITPLQIALNSIRHAEKAIEAIATGIDAAEKALATLRSRQEKVLTSASYVRRLLETQEHRSASRQRPGSKPAKRSNVDGGMPKGSSVHSRQPKARVRKRVARKQAVEVPRAGKKNIHYLKHGLCVCGMFSSPPVNWPYDHQWAPDWKDVNCPGCLSRKPSGKEFFHGQDIPH